MGKGVTEAVVLHGEAREASHQGSTLGNSQPLWWVLLGASVALRLLFLANPFELHGSSDFHGLGQRMLHGEIPYRGFTFEYPPLALPLVLVSGLVPAAWSATVLAVQSLLAEIVLVSLLRHDRLALRRYLLLTLPLTPLLSGGFDAWVMVAFVVAGLGIHRTRAAWSACAGAALKLFPAVWFVTRPPTRREVVPIIVTLAVLVGPLIVAPFDSTYLGFAVRRGVYQGAVPASLSALARWARGSEVVTRFRFGNLEVLGADRLAVLVLLVFGVLAAALVVRSWRATRAGAPIDPVLVLHAVLLCALCGGKVLSPQYVLIAVPTAAILGGRRSITWGVIGAMTIVPFASYSRGNGFLLAMALRNLVLVVETVSVARILLRAPVGAADWNRSGGSARMA